MLPHAFPLIAGATRLAKTSLVMRVKSLRTTWKPLEHIITPQIAQNQGNQEHKRPLQQTQKKHGPFQPRLRCRFPKVGF